jgi:uncharacterized protein GlcG (DUF336 family)
MKATLLLFLLVTTAPLARAQTPGCAALPKAEDLSRDLADAAAGKGFVESLGAGSDVGGLFKGEREWAAVVDRSGALCVVVESKPGQVWPASQAIAKAKAYTANGFSLDEAPLSTARLYTLAQPGHSLFGIGLTNPFDPGAIAAPGGAGKVAGGIVGFGGGVPLYRDAKVIGGLGVSGDTACADHEIAKRVRDLAKLNPPGGPTADDVIYASVDGPSLFQHPLCGNTKRNGVLIGTEQP